MESLDASELIRSQFNRQAENFSNWSVTQNRDYLQAYFTFCEMTPEDGLLDVACGSGEFALFAASQIGRAVGVDISDRMIELAQERAREAGITNVTFLCHDGSNIPFEDNSFSIVVCKSAFHHIRDYEKIVREMVRCCRSGGRVSIQDIVAYENDRVNDFFERLEGQVDISHHVTLAKDFVRALYERHNLTITSTFEVNVELNFREYLSHAVQSAECYCEIEKLLKIGLSDRGISKYFSAKRGELSFKRNVFLILGQKGPEAQEWGMESEAQVGIGD